VGDSCTVIEMAVNFSFFRSSGIDEKEGRSESYGGQEGLVYYCLFLPLSFAKGNFKEKERKGGGISFYPFSEFLPIWN